MNSNKRLLLTAALMLLTLAAATIINIAINFRNYAFNSAVDKAKITAAIVRDGLTAHMTNNIMDKRLDFLKNVSSKHGIEDLWIIRSTKVTDLFGDGFSNEKPRDEIDNIVLETAKEKHNIVETSEDATIRVTIPYVASAYGEPNCLDCHTNAKEGDVLGAISLKFSIADVRSIGALTIVKIFGINLLFIIITLYIINRYTKPFINMFDQLKNSIIHARSGDFNGRVKGNIPNDAKEMVEDFNSLFDKMDDTFGEVKNSLSTFVTKVDCNKNDPLNKANAIIHELADVYRFKKTIELDKEKEHIYQRFIHLLQSKFGLKHFALYEVNHIQKKRNLVFITSNDSVGESFCSSLSDNDANECRAYRTKSDIYSSDFPQLCEQCENKHINYICVPYQINDKASLVLSISTYNQEEYAIITEKVSSIKNYLEAAKPVIESKILLGILRDSSLKDGLTGLYNRRFLDEFVEKISAQSSREKVNYAVFMVDIDYFKMVNDTHGHDVGDLVIKRLAEILEANIREADLAIRFGGEEFLILLHNPTQEGAIQVAEKLRQTFEKTIFELSDETLQKTMSIGVALFPEDANSMWKAIKYADTALYRAKNQGRNQVVRFKESDYEDEKF
jgi:two-component system, cell cycle response regulator